MLKQDYKDDINREEVVQLALKVLSKMMDSTSLTSDNLELSQVFLSLKGRLSKMFVIWCRPSCCRSLISLPYGLLCL